MDLGQDLLCALLKCGILLSKLGRENNIETSAFSGADPGFL